MENHKQSERFWNNRIREFLKSGVPADSEHIRRIYTPRALVEIAEKVIREESEDPARAGETEVAA